MISIEEHVTHTTTRLSDLKLEYRDDAAFLKIIIEHDHIPRDGYANNFDILREDMHMLAREEIKTFMIVNCQKTFMDENFGSSELYNELNTTIYEIEYKI